MNSQCNVCLPATVHEFSGGGTEPAENRGGYLNCGDFVKI